MAVFVDGVGPRFLLAHFQTLEPDVEDDDDARNDEGANDERIQEGDIAQAWQITGNGPVESDENQQVAAGHILRACRNP